MVDPTSHSSDEFGDYDPNSLSNRFSGTGGGILLVVGVGGVFLLAAGLWFFTYAGTVGDDCDNAYDCRSLQCKQEGVPGMLGQMRVLSSICVSSCTQHDDCGDDQKCWEASHCVPEPHKEGGASCGADHECLSTKCEVREEQDISLTGGSGPGADLPGSTGDLETRCADYCETDDDCDAETRECRQSACRLTDEAKRQREEARERLEEARDQLDDMQRQLP